MQEQTFAAAHGGIFNVTGTKAPQLNMQPTNSDRAVEFVVEDNGLV